MGFHGPTDMVKQGKTFAAGMLLGCVLAGCAGFAYRNYGLEGVRYEEGKLLGDEPKDDLPFSDCAPTQHDPHPCVVMFKRGVSGYDALKLEFDDRQNRLESCEKDLASCRGSK